VVYYICLNLENYESAAAKEIAIYISSSTESQNETDNHSNISISDGEKNDDNSSKWK